MDAIKPEYTKGRRTDEEEALFVAASTKHKNASNKWEKMSNMISTRSTRQIYSHDYNLQKKQQQQVVFQKIKKAGGKRG